MKCEYFDGCPVYARHGDALCERLFCNDRCPDVAGQESEVRSQDSAVKPKTAVKRGKR